eukprot:CAMPEP_0194200592 /NCGR_PEP_ID=MMETSP0156-20130528/1126_1 /TAXON_ID=33649 /ORGANISM="Thalassionema nitzschioides, Strain L26-B" /LENGTH=895 /DNA_ID=CAMNT_0038925605 /DNA_START=103 /DNA_END=2790 /DNA_ORIENTATION=-
MAQPTIPVDDSLEEVEGLIRMGGSSGVGTGRGARKNQKSYAELCLAELMDPKHRKRIMILSFVVVMLLLMAANDMGQAENGSKKVKQEEEEPTKITFVDPADLATNAPVIVIDESGSVVDVEPPPKEEKPKEEEPKEEKPKEEEPKEEKPKEEEPKEEKPKEEEPKQEEKPKPKRNDKIPLLEKDLETLPIDDTKRDELAEKYGKWGFWDGDAEIRPKDYLSKYPNSDIPGDDFPQDAWQTDAVYVNHFLNDADKLIDRAMEAIFEEYGHGKPLPPEELASRFHMFHWEKIDMANANEPPSEFSKRGARDIGGWTTKRSMDGLVRRLTHAMMTQDTFTVVLAGHSAAQGQGNHFRQSYAMQFHHIMKPIFERLGVKLITRNMSQGGLGTLQGGMGSRHIYGSEIDLFLWDSGMTENGVPHHIDLVLRQVLMSGNRVPVVWGGPFELLKLYHEECDADVGEWGNGYAGIPETVDEKQGETLPWAARNMKCVKEREDLCNENRYSSVCWIDREDGIKPEQGQRERPRGQVKWHPGWRPHQLMGRVLAFSVLEALEVAVNQWMGGTMTGQPLDDSYWHVTDYYENIRSKVMKMDPKLGKCPDIAENDSLPARLCSTPLNGRTQYTPRADYEGASLTTLVKPAPSGRAPKNELKALYDGPDMHIPAYDIPEGQVDVLSIVMGRRRQLRQRQRRRRLSSEPETHSKEEPAIATIVQQQDRQLDEIVPGEGWDIAMEPQGICDGSYDAVCSHDTKQECFLLGHHDGRGAIVGSEYAGWLVMTLPKVQKGLIVVKLQTWHTKDENPTTSRWKSVNNERKLMRSYNTPTLNNETFAFDYAIDGEITTLNTQEFLERKHNLQRVVETMTLLNDEDWKDEKDVEVAIRIRGTDDMVLGVSHVYWA